MYNYLKAIVAIVLPVIFCSTANAQSGDIVGGIQKYSTGISNHSNSNNSSQDAYDSFLSTLPKFQLPVWLKRSFSFNPGDPGLNGALMPTGPHAPDFRKPLPPDFKAPVDEPYLTPEMKAAIDAFAELIIVDPKRVRVVSTVMPALTEEESRILAAMDLNEDQKVDIHDFDLFYFAIDAWAKGLDDLNGDGVISEIDEKLKLKLDLNGNGDIAQEDLTIADTIKGKSRAEITLIGNKIETTVTVSTLGLSVTFVPNFMESIIKALDAARAVEGVEITTVGYWSEEVIRSSEDVDLDGNLDIDEQALAAADFTTWTPGGQYDIDNDGNMDVNEDVNNNGALDSGVLELFTVELRTKLGSIFKFVFNQDENGDGPLQYYDMRLIASNGRVTYFDENGRAVRITEKCDAIYDIISSIDANSLVTSDDLVMAILSQLDKDSKMYGYAKQLFAEFSDPALSAAELKDRLLQQALGHDYLFASVDYLINYDGTVGLSHIVYHEGSGIEITYLGEIRNYEMMAYHPGHYGLAYQIKKKDVRYNAAGKPVSAILYEIAYDKDGELLRNRVKSESYSYNSNGDLVFRALIDRVNGVIVNKLTETIYYRYGVKYMKFLDIVNRDSEGNITNSTLSREEYTNRGNIAYNKTVNTWNNGIYTSTSETRNNYTWDGRLLNGHSTYEFACNNGDYSYKSSSTEEYAFSYHDLNPDLRTWEYRSYESTDNNGSSWSNVYSKDYYYDDDCDLTLTVMRQSDHSSYSTQYNENIERVEYTREIVDGVKLLTEVHSSSESATIDMSTGERRVNWTNSVDVQYGYQNGLRTDRTTSRENVGYNWDGSFGYAYKSDEAVMYDISTGKIISGNRQDYSKYSGDGEYMLSSSLNFDRMYQPNGNLLFSFTTTADFDADGNMSWSNESEQWYNEEGKIVSSNNRSFNPWGYSSDSSEIMTYYPDNKTLMQWTVSSFNNDGSRNQFAVYSYDQNERLTSYHKQTNTNNWRDIYWYDTYDKIRFNGDVNGDFNGDGLQDFDDPKGGIIYRPRGGNVQKDENCEYIYNEDGTLKSATYGGIQVTYHNWWSGRPWERPCYFADINWTMNTKQEYQTIMVDGVPQTKISHVETHKRGWEDQGGYLIYTLDLKRFIYGETNTEYDPLSGYPVIQDPSTIKPGDPQAYTPFWLQYEDEASIKGDRIILEKYFPMEKQRDDHPSLPTYASYEYDLKVDIERDQETGKLNKVNINYTGYNASGEKEYVLNGEYFYNKEGELEKMNEVTEGEMPNYYPWHDVIYRNMNEADPNADNKLLEADQVKFDVTASERLKNAEAENAKNNEGREAIEESSVNKIITENDRTLSRKQAWMSRQRQAVEDMKTAWDVKPVNKNTVYKPIVDPAMKDSQSENI